MARNEIHVKDTVTLRYTVKDKGAAKDVSGYTTEKSVWLRKPSQTAVTATKFTLTNSSDGTDGKVQYKCATADLDVKGEWESQVYIENPSGDKFSSDWIPFPVKDNLDPDNQSG